MTTTEVDVFNRLQSAAYTCKKGLRVTGGGINPGNGLYLYPSSDDAKGGSYTGTCLMVRELS